jgi:acyl-CoA thioester hydrolase
MNAPPTELWDHADPFVLPVSVTEADIDGFGHVNNAVYLRWLTECAWAHSAAVGLPEDVCVALRRGMAVRSIHLDLLASAYLGDALLVGDWLTANDRRLRATRTFQIVDPARRVTLLRGHVDYVCINLDTGRPARMPAEFLERYAITLPR